MRTLRAYSQQLLYVTYISVNYIYHFVVQTPLIMSVSDICIKAYKMYDLMYF